MASFILGKSSVLFMRSLLADDPGHGPDEGWGRPAAAADEPGAGLDDAGDVADVVLEALGVTDRPVGEATGWPALAWATRGGRVPVRRALTQSAIWSLASVQLAPTAAAPPFSSSAAALGGRVAHDGEVAPGEGVEGHGDEDGQVGDAPDAAQGRQGFAQVVLGLDDEDVDAAGGQATGLLGERVDELRLDARRLGA